MLVVRARWGQRGLGGVSVASGAHVARAMAGAPMLKNAAGLHFSGPKLFFREIGIKLELYGINGARPGGSIPLEWNGMRLSGHGVE